MVSFPRHTHPLRDSGNSRFPTSFFVFKFKPTDGTRVANPSAELVIDRVIPIVGAFSISVALSKRNTIDLRNPSSPLTMNQPRTGMRLPLPLEHNRPLFSL